ncbi:MAG: LytTR family DNA-binding domain-containing protein [Acidobacteriaceae bacterium]
MAIRTLVVDDEPLARERMIFLLEGERDIEVAAQRSDGRSALNYIERNPVDLALLDIQMPEMNGFEMVKQLAPERMPCIIFVTVYDEYALQAFAVHAADYLLKPVEKERLTAALDQVRKRQSIELSGAELHGRMTEMLADLESRRAAPGRILLKSEGQITFYDPEQIDWIESAGNYVTLHAAGKKQFLRETLSGFEKKLKPYGFVRISRSVVVNTTRIKCMKSAQYGDYSVQLRDSTELMLNRRYREAFFKLVERRDG